MARKNESIEKIGLAVLANNERAIHVYKKLGFLEEGRRVKEVKLGPGSYVDDILMYQEVWGQHEHAMFIFYVKDQEKSKEFYKSVLGNDPSLDVPGMTEFLLGDSSSLGLMPENGIKKLLGEKLPHPNKANGIPRAELYLIVDDPSLYHSRALEAGAQELSKLEKRNWGDEVAYSMDMDGHVLAFAKRWKEFWMKSLISHLEFNVIDYKNSILFYDKIFPFMGLKRINCTKQYTAYTDGMSKIILIPTEEKYLEFGFHRKRPGLNHLAFYSPSKEKVDQFFHEIMVKNEINPLYEKGPFGDGICDRLLHNCHKLKLQGESYRKKSSNLTQESHPGKD